MKLLHCIPVAVLTNLVLMLWRDPPACSGACLSLGEMVPTVLEDSYCPVLAEQWNGLPR